MKIFKYFIQFTVVLSLFATFRIIGLQSASFMGSCLAKIFGPLFRSKKIIEKNLKICFNKIDQKEIKKIWFWFYKIKSSDQRIKFRHNIQENECKQR